MYPATIYPTIAAAYYARDIFLAHVSPINYAGKEREIKPHGNEMDLAGDPNERVRDREAARGERSPMRRDFSRSLRERLIITDDKNP